MASGVKDITRPDRELRNNLESDIMYSLVGVDGNAYAIMGYVKRAMRKCGFSLEEQKEYIEKAMSGDYNNLLVVSMDYVDKCNERVDNNE